MGKSVNELAFHSNFFRSVEDDGFLNELGTCIWSRLSKFLLELHLLAESPID